MLPKLIVLSLALVALAAPPARAQVQDALDRVNMTGAMRWGCDAEGGAPYVYADLKADDRYVGFEVELADAIAGDLGARAERTQNAWSLLLAGLPRGDYEIAMNGLEITPENAKIALFSKPYYVSTLAVTVRRGDPPATTFAALRGKRVGALKSSFAERLMKDAGLDVSAYEGQVQPYADLRFQRIDAVVMDWPIARYYGQGEAFDNAPAEFGEARYGIAAAPGQEKIIRAIDRALDNLTATGKLREIYDRYGIWNQATAVLLHDESEMPKARPVMLDDFRRQSAPLTFGETVQRYRVILKKFGQGALMTVALSVTSMAFAVVLGLALALMRVYGPAPLRWASLVYVEGIRGTPLLIQLYIIFYALPEIGLTLPKFAAAVLGLGLNYAAYEAENYRAGLTSIGLGQTEAAHALGLTQMQTIRHVIVPQALRLVIPPVTNDFIALLKDSSIVSLIAMSELTQQYNEAASATGERIKLGLIAAFLYFLLGWPFARLAKHLEERARKGRR